MTKINQLIKGWPKGAVCAARHLHAEAFTSGLLSQYKDNGWIESVGRGAYKLANDTVEWMGGVYAIQSQLGLSIHPGGRTALELRGYAHYLPAKTSQVFLYGAPGEKLPAWFRSHDWGPTVDYLPTNAFPSDDATLLTAHRHGEFTVTISSPELGAMEMLYHVPKKQSFDHAYRIMESLVSLRPDVVQRLLERCKSVKVKRLFMYMAEKCNHAWVKKVDTGRVNFGRGKRVIVKGGTFDAKYAITVPEE